MQHFRNECKDRFICMGFFFLFFFALKRLELILKLKVYCFPKDLYIVILHVPIYSILVWIATLFNLAFLKTVTWLCLYFERKYIYKNSELWCFIYKIMYGCDDLSKYTTQPTDMWNRSIQKYSKGCPSFLCYGRMHPLTKHGVCS